MLTTAKIAAERHFGSVVLQGGERTDSAFIGKITRLLKAIKSIDTGEDPPLGITLSLGEQSREIYEEWFDAGAHRYLLRIEPAIRTFTARFIPTTPCTPTTVACRRLTT